MSLAQFATSVSLIRRAEHTKRINALLRHVLFQGRKLLFPRPLTLRLSRSYISDTEPGGVISMVNMLGMYDYNNMNLVQKMLRGGGLMIDVGANIGSYSLIASEQAGARVVALEPNPIAHAKLQRNLRLNDRTNVEALQLAASAAPGVMTMTNLPQTVLNRIVTERAGKDTIAVEVTTLDRLCAERGEWPCVLKLDVEGHEPAVLAGAASCLAAASVVIIENAERPDVARTMQMSGWSGPFYYYHADRSLRPSPQRLAEDGVFISPRFGLLAPDISIARSHPPLPAALQDCDAAAAA